MKLSDLKNPFNRGGSEGDSDNDLGFGTSITTTGQRLINRDGSFNIVRRGMAAWRPYQSLVEMSWAHFLAVVALFYIATNALFAAIFVFIGVDSLSGVQAGNSFAGEGADIAAGAFDPHDLNLVSGERVRFYRFTAGIAPAEIRNAQVGAQYVGAV